VAAQLRQRCRGSDRCSVTRYVNRHTASPVTPLRLTYYTAAATLPATPRSAANPAYLSIPSFTKAPSCLHPQLHCAPPPPSCVHKHNTPDPERTHRSQLQIPLQITTAPSSETKPPCPAGTAASPAAAQGSDLHLDPAAAGSRI